MILVSSEFNEARPAMPDGDAMSEVAAGMTLSGVDSDDLSSFFILLRGRGPTHYGPSLLAVACDVRGEPVDLPCLSVQTIQAVEIDLTSWGCRKNDELVSRDWRRKPTQDETARQSDEDQENGDCSTEIFLFLVLHDM
jgi:hypothetical protein